MNSIDQRIALIRKKRSCLEVVIWEVAVAAILVILLRCVIGIAVVKGDSMLPAYENGDIVIYDRISRNYQQKDVVIIKRTSQIDYIKRIVAVPGQTVEYDEELGIVLIDGSPYIEDYIYQFTANAADGSEAVTMNTNQYYCLGDNRNHSKDSRVFGPVEEEDIQGKVLMVLRLHQSDD